MKFIILTTPWQVMALSDLIRRGFASVEGEVEANEQYLEIWEKIGQDHMTVLVGFENNDPKGFSVIIWPASLKDKKPQILHFYSQGTKGFTRALRERTVEVIGEKGYIQFMAVNGSFHGDKAWLRALTPNGWSPIYKGSLFEFRKGTSS